MAWFPNSVWEPLSWKLCFASAPGSRETEFPEKGSQREFGNQENQERKTRLEEEGKREKEIDCSFAFLLFP
jgi:hypothetical protein